MPTSVATLALRIWWPIVAVLAVLGGAAGHVATRDAPYLAATQIRVDTAGFGEVAAESIVQTARVLVDSNLTYRQVVGPAEGAIEELRQRTTVDVIATSSVLEVVVTAQTAEQAEREVDALAEAGIATVRELAAEQFADTIADGADGLAGGGLPDPVAEETRREALGAAVAAQQDTALRLSGSLSRVGEVLPAVREGVGGNLAIVIGLFAGAVVGTSVALLLGVRRRRIKSVKDIRRVAPSLIDCEPFDTVEGVSRVAAQCSRLAHPFVAILALRGGAPLAEEVSAQLGRTLRQDGRRPFQLSPADIRHGYHDGDNPRVGSALERSVGIYTNGHWPPLPAATSAAAILPTLGMPHRATDLAAIGHDLLLAAGEADVRTLQQIAGRPDVVVLVGQVKRVRLGQLADVVEQLRLREPPIVVLLESSAAPAANPSPMAGGGLAPPSAPPEVPEGAMPGGIPAGGPRPHSPTPQPVSPAVELSLQPQPVGPASDRPSPAPRRPSPVPERELQQPEPSESVTAGRTAEAREVTVGDD